MTRTQPIGIDRVIAPQSIALIGATEDYAKFGGRFLHHIVDHGYKGRIFPINPRRESVLGLTCYPSIMDLPEAPDLALVAVPAPKLAAMIEECGKAGVGVCVVVTAKMAEFGAEGAALEAEIVAIAKRYNMRLVGPNCMGFILPSINLALSSTPTLRYSGPFRHGGVSLISQSGALMGSLYVQSHDHGVGLAGMVSIGNQADLELCDFLEGFIADPATKVICLYIEGVKSPSRLRALALRARAAGKILLAVKAGRTDAGSTLAHSHTSSLAGSFSAFETLCRETGIQVMDDPDSMILVAGILDRAPAMGPGGIGVVCSSGGGGAVLADRMDLAGLPVASYAEVTRARMDADFQRAHQNNPLDLGAHTGDLEFGIFERGIHAVHDDPGVALLAYVLTPQPLMPQTAQALIDVWKRQEKPVLVVLNTSRFAEDLRQMFLAAGVPVVARIDDALRVMSTAFALRDAQTGIREAATERPAELVVPDAPRSGFLTEPEVKTLLSGYGVAVPQATPCATPDDAVSAAETIGYPVVLKGVADGVVHKSDLGLVQVGLDSADAVRTAFATIAGAIAQAAPGTALRIDVQQMIGAGTELIVGVTNEPDFGPQLVVGAGGIHVELLKDVTQASAPVTPLEAEAMLRRLRIWPLLAGVRGQAPADLASLCQAISRISWLAADLGEALVDLEVNPLRATPQGAYALDGRATLD
ncbi:acetate--CoA ligase family protein [Pararhodobacter zhoushanensis]|uniref:acetate--CoA ligase family protein n=1 Tax=Pararhodobacter zhoushanensis TaxID=2479545 RepID=UPI000F8F1337|nr:acetate--CoA ligase family protein [Pararhodobacter zhoushanensis]